MWTGFMWTKQVLIIAQRRKAAVARSTSATSSPRDNSDTSWSGRAPRRLKPLAARGRIYFTDARYFRKRPIELPMRLSVGKASR